jgi:hypothetical protein
VLLYVKLAAPHSFVVSALTVLQCNHADCMLLYVTLAAPNSCVVSGVAVLQCNHADCMLLYVTLAAPNSCVVSVVAVLQCNHGDCMLLYVTLATSLTLSTVYSNPSQAQILDPKLECSKNQKNINLAVGFLLKIVSFEHYIIRAL